MFKDDTSYFKIALIDGQPKIVSNKNLNRHIVFDNAPIFLSYEAAIAWLKFNYSHNVAIKALEDTA